MEDSLGFCSDATEESPLVDDLLDPQQERLTRRFKSRIRQELRKHVADNVRMGLYQLKPLVHKQCRFCRGTNIVYFMHHEEMCQDVIHTFGCPCGFLCSTMKSLGGHSRTCEIAQSIKLQGDSGWIPYVTYDFRQRFLSESMYFES